MSTTDVSSRRSRGSPKFGSATKLGFQGLRIAVVGDSRWHDKRPTGIGLVVSVGIVKLGETIL